MRLALLTLLCASCSIAEALPMDATVKPHLLSMPAAWDAGVSCAPSGSVSVRDCPGVVGDGIADDWAALQSCLNTHPSVRVLFPKTSLPLPPGQVLPNVDYRLSQPLTVCGVDQTLSGVTGYGSGGTVLWWSALDSDGGATLPYAMQGVVFAPNATQPCDASAPCPCEWQQAPTGARLESINLRASATAYADHAQGILIAAVGVVLDHVSVQGFAGDGVGVVSDMNGVNASDFLLLTPITTYNWGSGIHTEGANSEVGVLVAPVSQFNHKYGFHEDSFFGNLYLSPQTAGNLLGGFHAVNTEGSSQFLGAYAELDQPLSQVGQHNVIIGGNLGVDQTLHPGVVSGTLAGASGLAQSQTVFVQPAGPADAGSALSPVTLLTGGWADPSGVLSATASGTPSSGYIELRRANADPFNPTAPAGWWGFTTYTAVRSPFYYSLLLSDSTSTVGQGAVWIPRALFLGGANPVSDIRRLIVNAQSMPTGLDPWGHAWTLGAIALNSLTTPGQPVGWTYTAAGTWTAFGMAGVLSASTAWAAHAIDGSYLATTTVAVPGAAPGDTVSCGYASLAKDGYLLSGSVTAAGVVSVTLLDLSAAGWTLPSGTLRVDVVHHQ